MVARTVAIGLALLVATTAPVEARLHGALNLRPDGKVGRYSRTYSYTTGTYNIWSKSPCHGCSHIITVYPHKIEAHDKGAKAESLRSYLDKIASEHP